MRRRSVAARALRSLSSRLCLLSLVVAGCGGGGGGGTSAASPDLSGISPGGADMAGDMARLRPDLWMPSGCIKGLLQDEKAQALAGVSILACSKVVCFYATSGADGTFQKCGLMLQNIAVKTEEDLTTSPRRAASMCPITLMHADQIADVGTLTVPLLGGGATLPDPHASSRTSADIGDGLKLSLVPADVTLPLGFKAPFNFAARAVPADKRCPLKVPDGGQVLAVYALSPFTATVAPSTVGFTAALAAPAASEVHFWSISELDGSLTGPAIGHADAMGKSVSTDNGQGLAEISWLVISSKP